MKKTMKKASYGMKRRKMGGDYMEPNKELKFGAPRRKKRKKAQQSTGPFDADPISGAPKAGGKVNTTDPMTGRNAASGDNMRTATKSTTTKTETKTEDKPRAGYSGPSREEKQNTRQGTGAGRTGKSGSNAKTEAKTETKKESGSQEKKSNPYSDAKAKDPKLDDYIKERNRLRDSGKKGSAEYNAVQNKINAAYGKGPTNRPTSGGSSSSSSSSNKTTTGTTPPDRRTTPSDSEKKTETKTESKTENKTETKSDTKSTPSTSTSSDTESSYKPTTKKGRRIQKRGMKKTDRINKRAFNQDSRQLKRKTTKDMKDLGVSGKVARKAGKVAKATFKGKTVKAALATKNLGKAVRKENEKRLKRADADRARASVKTNVDEARGRKRASAGAIVGAAAPIASALMKNSKNPNVQAAGDVVGAAGNVAGSMSKAKAKGGRYKAKSGFGMLSVKAGIDNNPNPTAADRIAGATKGKGMKDRRARKKKK